jgi:SH3-like domain-containing protein
VAPNSVDLTPLSTSPPAPAAAASPPPVPGYVITATDGAGANLRVAPSMHASIVTTLREGTPVEVEGEPVTAEGRSWQQIRSGDREGWVVAVVVRAR